MRTLLIFLFLIPLLLTAKNNTELQKLFPNSHFLDNYTELENNSDFISSKDDETYPLDDDIPDIKPIYISYDKLNKAFEDIAEKYKLPSKILKLVAAMESGWVINYESRGNYGIMGLKDSSFKNDYKANIEAFAIKMDNVRKELTKEGKIFSHIEDYSIILMKIYQEKYGKDLSFFIQKDIVQFYKDLAIGYTLTNIKGEEIAIPSTDIDYGKVSIKYEKYDYPNRSWVSQSVHPDNYKVSNRGAAQITNIVVHITGGSSLAGAVSWWHKSKAQRGGSVGSAHYIVDRNGDIYQAVHDKDMAWHAKGFNVKGIGIEHVGTVSMGYNETMYKASAKLSKWLCEKYNITKRHTSRYGGSGILGHNETGANKACPGPFNYDHYIDLILGSGSGNNCQNECTADSYRCSGNNLQRCSDGNNDGCVEWRTTYTCGGGTTCNANSHSCDNNNGCQNECSYSGEKRCGGDNTHTQTCVRDNSGCYKYVFGSSCNNGQTCSNGSCQEAGSCPRGDGLYCQGDDLNSCRDGVYTIEERCEYGCKQMPNGTPDRCNYASECQSDCSSDGELSCNGSKITICEESNGCYRKRTKSVCGSGFSCSNGNCIKDSGTGNNCEENSFTNSSNSNTPQVLFLLLLLSILFIRKREV